MKPTIYIESTIPSVMCSRLSRNLLIAAKQVVTRTWWENKLKDYTPYISEFVLEEISKGDPNAAQLRLEQANDIPVLDANDDFASLFEELVRRKFFPPKSRLDAAHVAMCSVHNIELLLTWNCTHIANPHTQPRLRHLIASFGHTMPVIVTPFDLMEES